MSELPDSAALSSAFFLHKRCSGTAAQTAQLSISLGELATAEKIQETWDAVARTSPLLQTGFGTAPDGGASLQPGDPQGLRWSQLDWSTREPADVPGLWSALLAEDLLQPVATDAPPLLRGTSIKLPGGSIHLLLTFPRFLLTEDAIFALICQWLAALEGHAPAGLPLIQADPAAPDVTDWWKKYLTGSAAPLELHILPKPEPTILPAHQKSTLYTREHSRRILDLASKLKVSPHELFLGLIAIVFGRLGGASDVLLLDATSLLPVRVSLDSNTPLAKWLSALSVKEEARLGHATLGLPQALSLGGLAPEVAFPIAFQWSPALLNDRIHDAFPRWINCDVKLMRQPIAPLTFEVRNAARFQIDLHFSPSVFSEAQVEALFDRFTLALEAALANSSLKLADIELLTESEHATITSRSNGSAPSQGGKNIQERIVETASRQPEDLAVRGEGDIGLTFSEVASHAQSLAAYLRRENLADGWVIATCLTPTPWVPVALLGVLQAGNTCVPLDPAATSGWLAGKTAACDAETIICDSQTARLFEGSTRRLLVIDRQWEEISAAESSPATPTVPKISFVLTGGENDAEPSLKVLSPQAISAACKESGARWRLRAGDQIPLLSTAGSGAYIETILSSLAAGATIDLPSDDSLVLSTLHEPTHLRLTLSQFRRLVLELKKGAQTLPESVRAVCIGNGSVPAKLFALWQSLAGEHVATHVFWSPADLSGLSLRSFFKGQTPSSEVPVGAPTQGLSVTFSDACGKELPPHYAGHVDIKLLDDSSMKWKLRAWRNEDGLLHLIDETAHPLPGVFDYHLAEVRHDNQTQLGLWLILEEPGATITPELRQAIAGRLAAHPDFLLAVEHFPLTSGGHIDTAKLPTPAPVVVPRPAPAPTTSTPSARPKATAAPTPAVEWEPLRLISKEPDAPMLLLVHDLDGDPARYDTLARLIKSDWTVYATVARGLRNPGACHQTVESEAATFVEAICSLDPAGPYHLFGYGYGAILAYEMARQLRRAGRAVNYIALAGSEPPALPDGNKSWLKPFARLFGGGSAVKKETAPSTAVAQAHLQARQTYKAEILEGPAGIILGSDLAPEVEDAWLVAVPEGFVERMSSPSEQMLVEPAVKRLAVILSEWTESSSEDAQ